MRKLSLSSGDVIIDRRLLFAEALAAEKDFAAAAELIEDALVTVPNWVAGWSLAGDWWREAGLAERAIACWQRLAALDLDGLFGAHLKLASLGTEEARPDPAYVEALFDDYAARFDESLVGRLGYRTTSELGALLAEAAGAAQPVTLVLDLGCGTGLMGAELRDRAQRLVGVDLSSEMLAEARRKGLYDELIRADLLVFLDETALEADLVTASDVLNYTGALPPVFAGVHRVLTRGGLFAFSLETHAGPEALRLGESLRFSHQPEAALVALDAEGFDVAAARSTVLRKDRGLPVEGLIVVARRR